MVFLQDEEDIEFAGAYFNLPQDPIRLTIDTTVLIDAWSPDLAAWNDWSGSPEDDVGLNADLEGTLDHPSPFDTLRYTGCICYRHPIPPSAILEAKEVPLPKYLSGL